MSNDKINFYFTNDTEQAIINYKNSTDKTERDQLFITKIKRPFEKIIHHWVTNCDLKYAGFTYDEIESDAIEYLLKNLKHFKEEKGKAFTYFTYISRNYLFKINNKNYEQMKKHETITNLKYKLPDDPNDNPTLDFFYVYKQYMHEKYEQIFDTIQDKIIAESILLIFDKCKSLSNFNKKALFIEIKEICNCTSIQISKVVNVFKRIYVALQQDFLENDKITIKYIPQYRNLKNLNNV